MIEWLKRLFTRGGGAPNMDEQTLSALTRGMQHAASSTFDLMANQYLVMLAQFFDPPVEKDDGKLRAKMVYVKIDNDHWASVPLISLVAPRGLALDRMTIKLSAQVKNVDLKKATVEGVKSDADRASMRITMAPRTREGERRPDDVMDIEMVFAAGDPPEGIMRLIDAFANQIDPRPSARVQPDLKNHPAASLVYKAKPEPSGTGTPVP